jgi:hypothetical protein
MACECEWPKCCDGDGSIFCLAEECECQCGCVKVCHGCAECAVDEWPDEDELAAINEDDIPDLDDEDD